MIQQNYFSDLYLVKFSDISATPFFFSSLFLKQFDFITFYLSRLLIHFSCFFVSPIFFFFWSCCKKRLTILVISREVPRSSCQTSFKVVKSCLPWQTAKQLPRVFARRTQLRSRANMRGRCEARRVLLSRLCLSVYSRLWYVPHFVARTDCKDFIRSHRTSRWRL